MLNLRACDVPLRGRSYFLYPSLKEFEIGETLFDILAFSIYPKNDPFHYDPSIDDMKISSTVDKKRLTDLLSTRKDYCVDDLVKNGLIEIKDDGVIVITGKTEDILNRAYEIRQEFDKNNPGFYCCP